MNKYSVKVKVRKGTDSSDFSQQLLDKRFNLRCQDLIQAFKDYFVNNFGREVLDTFSFYKSSNQHLRIDDLLTGGSFTASCHFKGKGLYNPSEITTLFRMIKNSTEARQENIGREEVSSSNNYIKLARWVKIEEEDDTREAKTRGKLGDWFKEKWVRVDAPKKDGKYQPCGRNDTSKGKKPVCVPVNKAKNLDSKEKKNRIRQKRTKEKEPNPGKKPNVTKYTEEAGGKSNISNNHNIRFVGSMIDLNIVNPNMIKLALMGEENEIPTLPNPPFEMPEDPEMLEENMFQQIKESNPELYDITLDSFDSLFEKFVRFCDRFYVQYDFYNGDQAVEEALGADLNDRDNPAIKLYFSFLNFLRTASREMDEASPRRFILEKIIDIGKRVNIFELNAKDTVIRQILTQHKDELEELL
jgi:hypothetical protein